MLTLTSLSVLVTFVTFDQIQATESGQKYKEGKSILERNLIDANGADERASPVRARVTHFSVLLSS